MAFSDSWKIEKTLTRHHLQLFLLFGAHGLQLALNRGSRWSLTTEACKPPCWAWHWQYAIDEDAVPIQNICAIGCTRAQGVGSCQSVSIHFTVHRACWGPLFSSVQVPLWLCRALSVLDVFWFGQDLHLLPSIAPVPESPPQPLSSSFPTKNKERSELKESKIVNQFRDCVYVFPPFLGVVRVTVKEQYSKGGQRLLLKKQ